MATEAALNHEFLRISRREFQTNLQKIEKAVAKLTPEQVWARKHEQENSIGNLLLHLAQVPVYTRCHPLHQLRLDLSQFR